MSIQKVYFFWVCIKILRLERAKDLLQMVHVLLLSSTVNQYIIKVYHYKFTDKWSKQLSHHSHKGARNIGQSKEYNQSFIQLILSFKCSFSFIP